MVVTVVVACVVTIEVELDEVPIWVTEFPRTSVFFLYEQLAIQHTNDIIIAVKIYLFIFIMLKKSSQQ